MFCKDAVASQLCNLRDQAPRSSENPLKRGEEGILCSEPIERRTRGVSRRTATLHGSRWRNAKKLNRRHHCRQDQPPDLGRHGIERRLALAQPQARRRTRTPPASPRPERRWANARPGKPGTRKSTAPAGSPAAARSGACAVAVRDRPGRRGSGTARMSRRRGRWACCSWSAGRSALPGAAGRKSAWCRCWPARCSSRVPPANSACRHCRAQQ